MSTLFNKKSRLNRAKKRKKQETKDSLFVVDDNTKDVIVPNVSRTFSTLENEEETNKSKLQQKQQQKQQNKIITNKFSSSPWATFNDLGLDEPLMDTCRSLGFQRPTPVQRVIIPYLINEESKHILALAATGSGKTAAFCLPILHHLSNDPYGIYAIIVSPTRELAKQIHQQVLALGSSYNVTSALVVGGLDSVKQSCELDRKPHFVVATPGRLAELLRGPNPPQLKHVRYLVLDEADRLLASNSGFERDVAELLLHCRPSSSSNKRTTKCQTLLFSATMTRSLESIEKIAGAGRGRLPLQKFIIKDDDSNNNKNKNDNTDKERSKKKQKIETNDDDNNGNDSEENEQSNDDEIPSEETPRIPAGLKQEYIFMPSRVRDAYLLSTIRTLMSNGGRSKTRDGKAAWTGERRKIDDDDDSDSEANKARSAIVFVPTCERAALVSGILEQVGVNNVALHSLLSQHRRLAALGKFKSQHVRVLVATDVASRGLDIPCVDLVINWELPRNSISYVHRVGRTARAGRRGHAISLVGENDISLVHAAERTSGRSLEKCLDITDEAAIKMLGPVTKAARLTKMKLMDIGFDELVQKFKERKARDRKERKRLEKALKRMEG